MWRERGGNEFHLIVSQTHRPPKFNSQSRFEREGQAGGSAAVLTLVAAFSQPNTRGRGVDVGCGVWGEPAASYCTATNAFHTVRGLRVWACFCLFSVSVFLIINIQPYGSHTPSSEKVLLTEFWEQLKTIRGLVKISRFFTFLFSLRICFPAKIRVKLRHNHFSFLRSIFN